MGGRLAQESPLPGWCVPLYCFTKTAVNNCGVLFFLCVFIFAYYSMPSTYLFVFKWGQGFLLQAHSWVRRTAHQTARTDALLIINVIVLYSFRSCCLWSSIYHEFTLLLCRLPMCPLLPFSQHIHPGVWEATVRRHLRQCTWPTKVVTSASTLFT